LLFTDADTEHAPDSLKRAVATLRARQAGMLSTLPYHAGTAWWERLTGPFHVLMLTVTRPYGEPQARRAYAIGQYLLFARDAYLTLGGHAAVRDELVEDLPLAQAFIAQGGRYVVATDGAPYFRVRMYASLAEFVAGWRRNVRAGLGRSPALAPVEVTLMILALVGGGTAMWPAGIVLAALAIGLTARAQRRLGAFSAWGAVLFPFAVALFSAVTVLAVFDMATRRPQVWKGRAYPAT
jgi:chlorobactene glucosyltransferase